MKDLNFDWLLSGSCLLSDVAMAYFTTCVYPRSAGRQMREQIERYPDLHAELLEAGYKRSNTLLTHTPANLYRDTALGNARHGVPMATRTSGGSGPKTVRRSQIRLIYVNISFCLLFIYVQVCMLAASGTSSINI